MATLQDIADRANIHPTTVSSILNGSKGNSRCSEETRQRVLKLAEQMGYVRNQLASRLRSKHTNTIGLVAGDIRNPFFASLATHLEEELERHGYQLLLLCRGWSGADSTQELERAVFEQPVDGFIVWSESAGTTVQGLSKRYPRPIITLGAPIAEHPGVRLDIAAGLQLAVEHLVRRGHRHVAYYAPEESRATGLPKPRPEMFEKIIARAGLQPPEMIFYPGKSWDLHAALAHARRSELSSRTTALIGFNDVATLGWLKAHPSKKVEAVSFDGTDWLDLSPRPVARVHIPSQKLARQSVQVLLARLQGSRRNPIPAVTVRPQFLEAGE